MRDVGSGERTSETPFLYGLAEYGFTTLRS